MATRYSGINMESRNSPIVRVLPVSSAVCLSWDMVSSPKSAIRVSQHIIGDDAFPPFNATYLLYSGFSVPYANNIFPRRYGEFIVFPSSTGTENSSTCPVGRNIRYKVFPEVYEIKSTDASKLDTGTGDSYIKYFSPVYSSTQ